MPTPTITTVRLTDLILDPEIQPRRRLDQGKLAEYADLYTARVELPPIVVFKDEDLLYVADGFHRTHAARKAGDDGIAAMVHEGTKRDAILYACTANSTHGLPLTADDKRRVVTRLLEDPEWQAWSDNAIAKHCGVSHPFVATVRSSLETDSSETQPRTYTTRHGTVATMKTGRIGRTSQPPAPVETQAPTPEVLTDGSSLLVHATTPLDGGSATPAEQGVPVFDLAELVQESCHILDEIGTQLDMLAEDYHAFTAAGGQPFLSTWAFATAPLPEGRGCDLGGLLASAAPLVTLLEMLKTQAEEPPETTTEPMSKRSQVLAVLPTLKAPYTAAQVAAATGLPITEARRALEGLVKVKKLVKVPGKPGQYLPARKR